MGNITVSIRVKPGSKKENLIQISEGNGIILLVEVKAPAVKGKANTAVVKLLKKRLKKRVEIIKGLKSSEKIIEIEDITIEELNEKIPASTD